MKLLHSNKQIKDLVSLTLIADILSYNINSCDLPKDFLYSEKIKNIQKSINQANYTIKLELQKYDKYIGKKVMYKGKFLSLLNEQTMGYIQKIAHFTPTGVEVILKTRTISLAVHLSELEEIEK